MSRFCRCSPMALPHQSSLHLHCHKKKTTNVCTSNSIKKRGRLGQTHNYLATGWTNLVSTLTRPGAYAHSTRTPTAVRLLPKVPVQVANVPFDNAALHQYVSAELSRACSASKAEAAASPSTDNVLDEEAGANNGTSHDGKPSSCCRLTSSGLLPSSYDRPPGLREQL